jgi:hypothetical protein
LIHRLAAPPPDAAIKCSSQLQPKLVLMINTYAICSESAANSLSSCTFSGAIEFHNRQYTMTIRLFYGHEFSQLGPGRAAIFTDCRPGLLTKE